MSKIKYIILIFVLIFTSSVILPKNIFATEISNSKGDVNNNGKIDTGDILLMLRHISAKSSNSHSDWILTEEKIKKADINNNGGIDVGDVLLCLRFIAARNSSDIAKKHPDWLEIDKKDEDKEKEDKKDEDKEKEDKKDEDKEKEDKNDKDKTQKIEIKKIELDKTKLTIKNGETVQIKVAIEPSNASNKNIIWTSSDTNIVTVKNGKITANKRGTATITAIAEDGSNVKATCKITVIQPVTQIQLSKSKMTLKEGETTQLKVIVLPNNANNKEVIWSSSNTKVATVENGKITAKKKGATTITAVSKDGSGKHATCKVTVKEVETTGVDIKQKDRTIAVGKDLQLEANILPKNATNKTIKWSTSDSKIATVSNTGKVHGVKPGIVTITAKTYNNKKDTCIIRVNIPAKNIELNTKTTTIKKGNTIRLTVKFNPTNTTDKSITWKSSDSTIATVANTKKATTTVTGKKAGTATITAISKYGLKAQCKVTIKEKSSSSSSGSSNKSSGSSGSSNSSTSSNSSSSDSTSNSKIKLFAEELYLSKGSTYDNFIVKESGGKYKRKSASEWKSKDKNIVSVSKHKSDGINKVRITGKKVGTTTVTVKYKDKEYKCKVHVLEAKIDIYISKNDGKQKAKMLLKEKSKGDWKILDEVLPKSTNRRYKWTVSPKDKAKLSDDKIGRPEITNMKYGEIKFNVIIRDIKSEKPGTKIKLEANKKIINNKTNKNNKNNKNNKDKDKGSNKEVANLKLFATQLYITKGLTYHNKVENISKSYYCIWSSKNKNIATVDAQGIIKAKKQGNAKINVEIKNVNNKKTVKTLECTVKVKDYLKIKQNKVNGGTYKFTVDSKYTKYCNRFTWYGIKVNSKKQIMTTNNNSIYFNNKNKKYQYIEVLMRDNKSQSKNGTKVKLRGSVLIK